VLAGVDAADHGGGGAAGGQEEVGVADAHVVGAVDVELGPISQTRFCHNLHTVKNCMHLGI
jgi:hypothetical protein